MSNVVFTISCPCCKFSGEGDEFYYQPTTPDCHPMCKLLPASETTGFFGLFKKGPTRIQYGCPKCGVVFIIP